MDTGITVETTDMVTSTAKARARVEDPTGAEARAVTGVRAVIKGIQPTPTIPNMNSGSAETRHTKKEVGRDNIREEVGVFWREVEK